MKLKIGSPATGEHFFPRIKLRQRLLRALGRDHVAFLGPRRTGKTSVLRSIERNPPEGVAAVFLNLEQFDNVPAWLNAMLAATRVKLDSPELLGWLKKSGKAAASAIKRIEHIQVLGTGIKLTAGQPSSQAWQPVADQFLDLLREAGLPIYFLLDEFPWFLGHVAKKHTPAEVESVLTWFRNARQELASLQARFLVTGSIGLDGLLRRLGLSPAANDFDTIEIPSLTDDEAAAFLAALAEGEGLALPERARRHIIKKLGANWPILLALFISEVQEAGFEKAPTRADIDRLYADQLVRGSRNKYCQEMFTRIAKPEVFSPSERRLALEILRHLTGPSSAGRDVIDTIHAKLVPDAKVRALMEDELDFVLDTLRHDGYIARQDDGRTRFASNILRDYWLHRIA